MGYSEEMKRNHLITGERARKHATARQCLTDTLGHKALAETDDAERAASRGRGGGGYHGDGDWAGSGFGGGPEVDDRWQTTSHVDHSRASTFLPRRPLDAERQQPLDSNSHVSFASWAQEV